MFHVDQKVVCIGGWKRVLEGCVLPKIGTIYTVRWIGQRATDDAPCLMLVEHFGGAQPVTGIEYSFNVTHFRPLIESKSSVSFTEGAPPDSERFDNRRKQKVRA